MAEEAVTIIDVQLSPSGTAAVDQYTQGMQKAGVATDELNQRVEQSPRSVSAATREMQNYLARLDPVFNATRLLGTEQGKLQTSLRGLAQDLATGAINVTQYADRHALLTGRANEVTVATQKLAAGTLSANDAIKVAKFSVNDLSDAHDHAAGAAGRLREGLVEVHEFIRGDWKRSIGSALIELQNFGAIAPIIGALKNPFVDLGIVGVAALGAILQRAVEVEDRLRSFNITLSTMGTGSLASAHDLERVVEQLRQIGISGPEASAAIQSVVRTPGINPAAAGQIVTTGANLGAFFGTSAQAGTQMLVQALQGGIETTTQLALRVNALSGVEAANRLEMARHGQAGEMLNKTLADITSTLDGKLLQSMGEGTRAINSISAAWSEMLTTLSDTGLIQGALSTFAAMMKRTAEDVKSGNMYSLGRWPDIISAPWRSLYNQMPDLGNPASNAQDMADALRARAANDAGTNTLLPGGLSDISRALSLIQQYESRGQNIPNYRFDPTHTAAGYFQITNQTWRGIAGSAGIDLGQYPTAMSAPYDVQRQGAAALYQQQGFAPWANYNPRLRAAIGSADLSVSSDLRAPIGSASGSAIMPTQDQARIVKDHSNALDRDIAATKEWGVQQELAKAKIQLETEAVNQHLTGLDAQKFVEDGLSAITQRKAIELDKLTQVQRLQTAGTLASADAYKADEVAGLRATAMAEAQLKSLQENRSRVLGYSATDIDVQKRYQQILDQNAVAAIDAGAKQVAAAMPVVAANERLASAAELGTAAEQRQQIQNEALSKTHNALTAALASGNQALIDRAKALTDVAQKQLLSDAAAKASLDISHSIDADKNQVQTLQLELSLQGASTDQISQQVTLLHARQDIEGKLALASPERKEAYIAEKQALADTNVALAEAQRNQQRIDDGFRQIGNTIDTTLTAAINDAFSGQKVTDWGATIKATIASIVSQLASGLFIKPLIGSVLSSFGLGSAAQQFGTLGGGMLGGGGSGQQLVDTNGNVLGTLSSGASLLNNGSGLLGELGLGNLFGGTSSFMNSIGGSLGFFQGIPNAPGLFGTTTLGSAFGAAGLGFGAGSLLNSLAGGNALGGTVGSGIGAIGGTLAGSLIGMPFLGGLLGGGAGGLLGGLFGGSQKRDNVAGLNIDSTGALSGAVSGSQQNNAVVQQIGSAVSGIIGAIRQAIPNANLPGGSAVLNSGDYSGVRAFYNGQQFDFSSAEDAIKQIGHFIADNLTGITDTLKTVLTKVTDPSQLQAAVQFANAYDDLKKASDSAFSSVEKDTQTIGPFATAMAQLNTTFGALKDQASQFGLALDPINAALAEATSRLQGDFLKSLDTGVKASSGKDYLNQLAALATQSDQQYAEATAIGLPAGSVSGRIDTITQQSAATLLKQLTAAQLQDVATATGQVGFEFGALAKSLLDAGQAADQLAASTQASNAILAAGIQIRQYLNSLDTSSNLGSPESRLAAAQSQYQGQLGNAQKGDVASLQGITGTAQTLIQAVQAYYASSGAGSAIIDQVKSDLAALPGVPDALTGVANKIVTSITDSGNLIIATTTQSAQDIIASSLTSSQAIIDNSTKSASAIVTTALAGDSDIVGATTAGAAAISGSGAVSASAITATIASTSGASAGSIIAASGSNTDALFAGNKENSATLVANDNANASALISANGQAASLFVASTNASATALIASSDDAGNRLVAANNNTAALLAAGADSNTGLLIRAVFGTSNGLISEIEAVGGNQIRIAAAVGDNLIGAVLTGTNGTIAATLAGGSNQIAAIFAASNSVVAGLGLVTDEIKRLTDDRGNVITLAIVEMSTYLGEELNLVRDLLQQIIDNQRRQALAA